MWSGRQPGGAPRSPHGLIRGSFVPRPAIQAIPDLTRTRKQVVRETAQHTLRLQKTLEGTDRLSVDLAQYLYAELPRIPIPA